MNIILCSIITILFYEYVNYIITSKLDKNLNHSNYSNFDRLIKFDRFERILVYVDFAQNYLIKLLS